MTLESSIFLSNVIAESSFANLITLGPMSIFLFRPKAPRAKLLPREGPMPKLSKAFLPSAQPSGKYRHLGILVWWSNMEIGGSLAQQDGVGCG